MKFDQLDKNKVSVAALTSVLALVFEEVLGMAFSSIYGLFYGMGLFSTIMYVVFQVLFTAAVFVAGYQITTRLIFKQAKVNMKELYEMALTTSLACIAFQRLLYLFGIYTSLSMIFIIFILFAGAYFLVPDMPSNHEDSTYMPIGQQTVYRKEKVVQKGSAAENFLNYAFLYAWGAGIIFTWGGFIVRPRSQAPGFYAIGIVCLAIAAFWTYQKIDASNIESYKKIILPDYWPKDCSYEKYHLGLNSRFAKQSGGLFGDKNMKFYQECHSSKINDLDSEYNMQKAIKIAEKQHIKDFNETMLREMYIKGKEMTEHDEHARADASAFNSLNGKRIEELNA